MDKQPAIERLQSQLNYIENLKIQPIFSEDFYVWQRDTEVAIEKIFGSDQRHLNDFKSIEYLLPLIATYGTEEGKNQEFKQGLDRAKSTLKSFIAEIQDYWDDQKDISDIESNSKPINKVELICNRFHEVYRQIQRRYNNRPALINDEYDVQDLFHSLLKLYFDDIRPEESNPSNSGSNSRSDFLLKSEKIQIEIKKTRQGLSDKKLGEELILDIQKYQIHPDCKTLICFVYDPDNFIRNPRGIERDLETTTEKIEVKVFIRPC